MGICFVIKSPIRVPLYTRKKDDKTIYFSLNLNEYRNKHHSILNNAKKIYHKIIGDMLKEQDIKKMSGIKCIYHLYKPSKRSIDFRNVISIVDKFFMDALVINGIIEDDNIKYYNYADDRYMGIDPEGKGFVLINCYEVTSGND